jgi:hypothetical protein
VAAADYPSWAAGIHVQCSHATSTFINLRVILTCYCIPCVYSTLRKLWWAPGPRLYALWAALGVGSGGTGVCFKHEICRPKHKAMYACSRPVIVINARCVIT